MKSILVHVYIHVIRLSSKVQYHLRSLKRKWECFFFKTRPPGYRELHATRGMPLRALAIALATGMNTRSFSVLDQNKTQFFTYKSQRAEGKAEISLGSFTGTEDFLLQLFGLESLRSEVQDR